ARCTLDDLCTRAGKTEPAQGRQMRALLRRQYRLRQAQLGHGAHLVQALSCRLARIGGLARIAGGGTIANGEPAIMVGGADQAVEIGFQSAHSVMPGGSCSGRRGWSLSSDATGQAQ